jgi:hypothetical protein
MEKMRWLLGFASSRKLAYLDLPRYTGRKSYENLIEIISFYILATVKTPL